MSKRNNDDPRPLQSQAPDEHKDREGATEWSGHQPAEKHSRQSSLPYSNDAARNAPTRSGIQK